MSESPEVRVELAPSRCPYCHDALASVAELVACAACGARHHEGCYREHGACASCAATTVLVPERAKNRAPHASLDVLPDDACFEVERTAGEDGDPCVRISWPVLPAREVKKTLLACLILLPLLGVGALLFLWYLFNRKRRYTLDVTADRLRFSRPGLSGRLTRFNLTRERVAAVVLNSDRMLSLQARFVSRILLTTGGVGNVVSTSEIRWLAGILSDWHEARLQLSATSRDERTKAPDPKRSLAGGTPLKAGSE